MGYAKWENFCKVIEKARTACANTDHATADHFPDVRKMVALGSGAQQEIEDIALPCYLVAQNGEHRNQTKLLQRQAEAEAETTKRRIEAMLLGSAA